MDKVNGVVRYYADYIGQTTQVTYDQTRVTLEAIMQALDAGGYPVMGNPQFLD